MMTMTMTRMSEDVVDEVGGLRGLEVTGTDCA